MDGQITPTANGPLQVEHIGALRKDRGETIDTSDSIYLCRCGASKNKPYCDGSHEAVGFSDRRRRTSTVPVREFAGREITVVDDFNLCAHAGECVDGAPDTFFVKGPDGRASLPDASPVEQVIATIRRCPSGSLLYKLKGKLVDDYTVAAGIRVEKDGPLHVHQLALASDTKPATMNHYTLCRCGASTNKPFCDGMHTKIEFHDGSA